MASPFTKAAQSAVKAATSLGATESVTVRRTTSTYTPSTGANTPSTTDYSWTVVVESYAEGLVNGTSVKAGDLKLIGASADLSVTPDAATDRVIRGGKTYSIVPSGLRSDPAGATWTVQVRR